MTNPSRRPSSRIVATIAASVAVATIQLRAADAAEECLATPQAGAPAGQHWFYRIEPVTKRHCWYLGDQGKASSRMPTSASAQRTAPDPSAASDKVPARPSADARAEFQMPLAFTDGDKDPNDKELNDKNLDDKFPSDKYLAVPSASPAPAVAPVSSEPGEPVGASSANPDRWSNVTGVPQPNAVAPSVSAAPATASMAPASAAGTNTPETNTGAATETTVTSVTADAAGPEDAAIGTTPLLIGLTSIILGALILLGLSGSAIYRRIKARAQRRSYRSFGGGSTYRAQHATQSKLDVDDNLHRMRDLLARLKHEAPPQSEDAEARLYSGQL
jgi:hypothetical protein